MLLDDGNSVPGVGLARRYVMHGHALQVLANRPRAIQDMRSSEATSRLPLSARRGQTIVHGGIYDTRINSY